MFSDTTAAMIETLRNTSPVDQIATLIICIIIASLIYARIEPLLDRLDGRR